MPALPNQKYCTPQLYEVILDAFKRLEIIDFFECSLVAQMGLKTNAAKITIDNGRVWGVVNLYGDKPGTYHINFLNEGLSGSGDTVTGWDALVNTLAGVKNG